MTEYESFTGNRCRIISKMPNPNNKNNLLYVCEITHGATSAKGLIFITNENSFNKDWRKKEK